MQGIGVSGGAGARAEVRVQPRTAAGTHLRRMTVLWPGVGIGPTGMQGCRGGYAGVRLLTVEPWSDGR